MFARLCCAYIWLWVPLFMDLDKLLAHQPYFRFLFDWIDVPGGPLEVSSSENVKFFEIISIESLKCLFERKHTCRLWQRLDVGCVPVPMFCLALSQNKSGINMSGQFHCGTLTRGRKIMFLYQSGTHSSKNSFFDIN